MLSFIQYLTEVQTNQTFGDGDKTYDVDGIIRRKQIKRANTRRVSDLIDLNKDLTNDQGNFHELLRNPTPEFMARVKKADTRFPIHVDTKGNVIDGSHRLAALHFAGQKYARVQVVGSRVLGKTKLTENDNNVPSYSGVVLDHESRNRLLSHQDIGSMLSGMEQIGHHMTIKMGGLEGTEHVVGTPAELTATHLGYLGEESNPSVVAMRVSGYSSSNAVPHITLGVNRELGGKPFHSNKIENWKKLTTPIVLSGKVQEVFSNR